MSVERAHDSEVYPKPSSELRAFYAVLYRALQTICAFLKREIER